MNTRVVALGLAALSATGALTAQNVAGKAPVLYQSKLDCCQEIVLGARGSRTQILRGPAMATGKYLVEFKIFTVMGRDENVVCWTESASGGGPGGVAGNGSRDSDIGNAGVYGNPVGLGAMSITVPGDRVTLLCESDGGRGTYVAEAVFTALRVGSVISS